ncbi:hypothetical protein DSO57_1030842 [Entomophthora muscae]|uniref:Uncharacterized protein n=1 Tax=Entomophthora muscae TaxID=34485 RepID=A0ACC2RFV3_9FUNG|nr:hypothetical protein DSO57_1030842 [Entomophthora muscae]
MNTVIDAYYDIYEQSNVSCPGTKAFVDTMKNLDLVDTLRERKNLYEYITYINKRLERGGNTGSRLDYILVSSTLHSNFSCLCTKDTKLSDHKAI